MKKLLVFLLILSCLSSTVLFKDNKNPIFFLEGVERACLVSNKEYSNMENVSCGEVFFNYCTYSEAIEKFEDKDVKAIQFYFLDVKLAEMIKRLNIEIVKTENLGEIVSYLGYTPHFRNCLFIDGKKVNVQLVESEQRLVAGFPAILTGF